MTLWRARLPAAIVRLSAWIASLVIAAAVLAATSGLLAGSLRLRLSGARLLDGLAAAVGDARTALDSRRGLAALAFALGMAFGWMLAVSWLRERLRRGSLLLTHEHRANMSFSHAVDYVAQQTGAARSGRDVAAAMIIDAARDGALSLWLHSPSNLMRRVPRRQVRRASARLTGLAEQMEAGHGPDDTVDIRLSRTELERLWPTTAVILQHVGARDGHAAAR